MDEEQLHDLYNLVKRGYTNSCWDTIQEALDYLNEYIEVDDDYNSED